MPKIKSKFFNLSLMLLLKNLIRLYYYLGKFLILLITIIFVLAYAISHLENSQFIDSLYFALITATTIGYGDITPLNYISKMIAVFLGFIGLTITGVVVATTVEAIRLTLKEQLSPEEFNELEI